jgi:polysaccharide export outer membrane protein
MKVEKMNFREKSRLFLLIFFVSLTLFSCASTSNGKKQSFSPEQIAREIESSKRVNLMNERLIMNTFSTRKTSSRDYKIGPQDLLEITVFEVEKLNKTVRVTSQGNINLPLLGILRVKGLSADELEKEIRSLLAEKYIQDPQVNVFIKEFRNQMISIIGSVAKPGVYDFTGQKTVLDLLAMAGGLRDDAGRLLFVIRPPNPEMSNKEGGSNNQKPTTFIIGLEELLLKGDPTMNLPLLHGDVVNIPTAGKVFVGGEVKNPGGYPLTRKMTVSQAITVAAGLTSKANGSETRIFRYSGKGDEKEVFKVNVYAIQKAQLEDPYVKENDIIFVPKSGTKTVLIEFWDILKGRIVGTPIVY